ncbi:MAG: hypothetical protein A2X86_17735 [Bdellovibrionales bacterium GWA2_49_15]|nr:MAG: hypothetical protein A2X86_17735 [Bdellovibrionales bacterium GWA2_49_15]HAZ14988.1 hypothetical protein [Bdellovibrionales bacterium]
MENETVDTLTDQPIVETKNYVIWTMAALAVTHFTLNCLYSPHLKWFFLFELICVTYYTIRLRPEYSILPLMYLFFIEGQGRIVWEYNSFFRIAFDLVCIFAVLKSLAIHKKLIPKKMPLYFEVALYLHIACFCIQLFNINNIGIFAVFTTSKMYIFPLLLFTTFLLNPLKGSSKELRNLQIFVVGLTFLEAGLSWYQMLAKEKGLEAITPYYVSAMKNGVFAAELFRPFATTAVAGAISAYLTVTVGFLFLPSWHGLTRKILTFITVVLSWLTIFLSQVRSSMIKHILIVLLSIVGFTLINKLKAKILIPNIIIAIFFYVLIFHSSLAPNIFKDIDINEASERFATLEQGTDLAKKRISIDGFIVQLAEKIYDAPLGLGPGRTGAASALNTDVIAQDPIYSLESSWTSDNLFIALAIDFGIGMIFYTFLVVGLPIYLFVRSIMMFIRKDTVRAQVTFTSAVCGLVIVAGNWGANGLPYNPESFMFWFWMAMGVNHAYEAPKIDSTTYV